MIGFTILYFYAVSKYTIFAQTYTGSKIMTALTDKDEETTLMLDTDYTVSCSNNINAALQTVRYALQKPIHVCNFYNSRLER